ncbi:MAG: acyltransferase [Imperialibacter sp.]|uniref:acyltransferase n=1 Tax=Imperialibacter sp. TaxID=2038411 RepID=UPI0032EF982B
MKAVLKKIYRLLYPEKREPSLVEKYVDYIQKEEDSILKSVGLRFDREEMLEKRPYLTIGKRCLITASFVFETEKGEVVIGDNVHIGGATFISRNKIEIRDDVTLAWGITVYDHNSHSVHWEERKNDNRQCYEDYIQYNGDNLVNKDWSNIVSKPILIESKVWIGFNVTILKGVTIGEGSVIGAGSVVAKDIPPWSVAVGNPAQVIRTLKKSGC